MIMHMHFCLPLVAYAVVDEFATLIIISFNMDYWGP